MTVERKDYDTIVAAFTALMTKKLRENDHKTHWRNQLISDLFVMLVAETKELEAELVSGAQFGRDLGTVAGQEVFVDRERPSPVKVARECADVANLALMIADVAGGLDMDLPARETVTIELLQREVLRLQGQVTHENGRWKEVYESHRQERDKRQLLEVENKKLQSEIDNALFEPYVDPGSFG